MTNTEKELLQLLKEANEKTDELKKQLDIKSAECFILEERINDLEEYIDTLHSEIDSEEGEVIFTTSVKPKDRKDN